MTRPPTSDAPSARLWRAVRHRASNPALMVFAANMLRAGCGFLIGLLVARVFGPAEFGLFTTFTVATIWAHNLIGEGFDPGVVRFYAKHHGGNAGRASAVLGSALIMRGLLVVPMLALFWVGSALWFAPDVADVVRVGALTAVAASFATLSLAVLQARERFTAYALLTPFGNLLRLLCVPLLWLVAALSFWPLIWTQVLCFVLTAVIGMSLLRADLRRMEFDLRTLRELFAFGKWTALANFCFLLQAYLAVPVLTQVKGAVAAGVYAAAATLLMVIDQFTVALLTVKLPATSRIDTLPGLRQYVERLLPRLFVVGSALLLLIPLADLIVGLVYGHAYVDSAQVMRALLPGFIATLISHPLYLVLYSLGRPQGYAMSGVAALGAWCLLATWLIPEHGVLGAAWATTGSRLLQSALIVGMVSHAIRHRAPLSASAGIPPTA
ncbi:MAG: oligosaccharide flippase family protein [Burkholderiaceae bacterium]|nr:oligosaccharide flippase family protein [Burkholderiaceae bacterium]